METQRPTWVRSSKEAEKDFLSIINNDDDDDDDDDDNNNNNNNIYSLIVDIL